ncbi:MULTISPECIES: hypothetical protein [Clostridium]|uniref:hypothetical protein n=1 Tax=Clostridium TaxID=1485 RepID=UPI00035BAEF3|nr:MULTISPECIES: hypothetical protein [Clostridium]EPS47723.1 hypothetical protein CFSAN002367_22750 [Clostridium botulinum CFSAN002367]KON10103.1 hypothetical protein ACP52_08155 [Clostridium botulinum]KOR54861.1 hypothetical protein ADT23_00260 [Clostridium botulinum]MBD5587635.1 hypothetical protein [Clostridium botulinum]MBY6839586.1 hypothetical protein [Clostridium botulinum]
MKNSKFDNVVIVLAIIAIIFTLIKVGFNLVGGIFSVIILGIAGGIMQENDKNKANEYLAHKYDEECKKDR